MKKMRFRQLLLARRTLLLTSTSFNIDRCPIESTSLLIMPIETFLSSSSSSSSACSESFFYCNSCLHPRFRHTHLVTRWSMTVVVLLSSRWLELIGFARNVSFTLVASRMDTSRSNQATTNLRHLSSIVFAWSSRLFAYEIFLIETENFAGPVWL